jgi:hypothetical protein
MAKGRSRDKRKEAFWRRLTAVESGEWKVESDGITARSLVGLKPSSG